LEEPVESRVLTIPEALELLRRRVEEAEATDLQSRTLEYLEMFSKCGADEARELFNALTDMGLKPETAAMIVNIAPRSRDELRTLLYGEEKTLGPEELDKILSLVARLCGKKD
jgi:DNA-directed RNA polymerase subunit F